MRGQKGFTFFELMVTVSILSIGIVGIYRVLLADVDYQTELSCRLYASNLIEHEVALMQQRYALSGELPVIDNGKVVDAVLNRRELAFQIEVSEAFSETRISGMFPAEIAVSWPYRDRVIKIKRKIFFLNTKIKPQVDEAADEKS